MPRFGGWGSVKQKVKLIRGDLMSHPSPRGGVGAYGGQVINRVLAQIKFGSLGPLIYTWLFH